MRGPPPLTLNPARSRWMMGYLALIHLFAAGAALLLDCPPAWRGALLMLALASLLREWRREVLRRGSGVVRGAEWDETGRWTLWVEGKDGRASRLTAELCGSTLIHPRLVLLNFRVGRWRRYRLPLPPDALAPDLARRLRLRLRVTG